MFNISHFYFKGYAYPILRASSIYSDIFLARSTSLIDVKVSTYSRTYKNIDIRVQRLCL